MDPRLARAFLLRFALLAALLGTASVLWGTRLVEALLPAFRAEIAWLDDTYRIEGLAVDHEGADEVVRLEVSQARHIVLAGRVFAPQPGGRANTSTLTGHVLLPGLLLACTALAWPARRWRGGLLRLPLIGAALVLLTAVNLPFVLWAGIWGLHVDAFAPETFSPLLAWAEFMQGGGEHLVAVGLALGVTTVMPE